MAVISAQIIKVDFTGYRFGWTFLVYASFQFLELDCSIFCSGGQLCPEIQTNRIVDTCSCRFFGNGLQSNMWFGDKLKPQIRIDKHPLILTLLVTWVNSVDSSIRLMLLIVSISPASCSTSFSNPFSVSGLVFGIPSACVFKIYQP